MLQLTKLKKAAGSLARDLLQGPPAHPQPETDYPSMVQLETTGLCNLRCVMCPTTYYPTNNIMEDAVFESVLDAAPHLVALAPYIGGEPFVLKNFIQIVERIRERAPNVFLCFNTNATLLTPEKCEAMVRLGVNEIIVSMDGATAETYNAIRVRADFEKTLANVRMLVKAREDAGAKLPRLGFLLVAHRDNYREIPALARLAADLGLEKLMVNGMEPYQADQAGKILYGRAEDPEIAAVWHEAQAECARLGIEWHAPSLVSTGRKAYCPSMSICIVRSDGEVQPCAQYMSDSPFWYHGEERRHFGPLSFGNVKERSLKEIWKSPEYVAFRENLRRGKLHKECTQCLLAEGLTCNVKIYPMRATR